MSTTETSVEYGKSQKQPSQMFFKIGVLKNLEIFTGKHLCLSFPLIKLQALAWNIIKKRLQHRCFPLNIAKFLRTTFFYKTPLMAASLICSKSINNKDTSLMSRRHSSVSIFNLLNTRNRLVKFTC